MTRQIELRLLGHDSGDGELLAADAVALVSAFKEIAYRLTRAVAEGPGLGRTKAVIEKLSTVRVGLRPGSTRVVFTLGDEGALLDPLSEQVDDAFWAVVEGLRTNTRPVGLAEPVADAVDSLVVALAKAAPRVEVTVPGHDTRALTTQLLSRSPWQRQLSSPAGEETVHGVLEMVDLRSARFRLRDAAGNTIDIIDVVEPAVAATLVGQLVSARGLLAVGNATAHHRLSNAVVAPHLPIEHELGLLGQPSLDELLVAAEAAPSATALDLTDDDLDDLLDAIRAE